MFTQSPKQMVAFRAIDIPPTEVDEASYLGVTFDKRPTCKPTKTLLITSLNLVKNSRDALCQLHAQYCPEIKNRDCFKPKTGNSVIVVLLKLIRPSALLKYSKYM